MCTRAGRCSGWRGSSRRRWRRSRGIARSRGRGGARRRISRWPGWIRRWWTGSRGTGAGWRRGARIPVLRTAVVWEGVPEPLQVVCREARIPVTRDDWRGLPGAVQEEKLRALREREAARGLDLSAAPLMRVALARVSDTRVHLLWCSHHILLDGWSLADVLAEVFDEYARLTGGAAAGPAARRPFRDYLE